MFRKLLVAAFAAVAVVLVLPANPAHACVVSYVCVYKDANYAGGEAQLAPIVGYYPSHTFNTGTNINDRVTSIKNRDIITHEFNVNAWWSGDSFKLNPWQYTSNVGTRFNDKLSSHH